MYAFIGTVMLVFSSFCNFGIVPMAIREISRNRSKVGVLFNHILSLRVGIILLLYPILVLVVNILGYNRNIKYLIYIAGLSAIFSTFSNSFTILYIAFERFKVPSFISILISFLSTGNPFSLKGNKAVYPMGNADVLHKPHPCCTVDPLLQLCWRCDSLSCNHGI